MTERQLIRTLRCFIALLFVLGAAEIAIVYAPFSYAPFDIMLYRDVQLDRSHRLVTMVVLILAPGVLVWRSPRWRHIAVWVLFGMVTMIWAGLLVQHPDCRQLRVCTSWATAWPVLTAALLFAMMLVLIVLFAIAGYQLRHNLPAARVLRKRDS